MTEVGIRERKKVATRKRILAVAIQLFSAEGIDRVTVEEIAAAAGVGKGTVYNYFAAKEDMVVAFLLELDRPALAAMPGLAAAAATPADALDAAAWSLLANKVGHHGFVKAFLTRLFAADGFAEELGGFQQALDTALEAFFETLLVRPDAASRRSREELILSFKTMHLGLSALWVLEGPPFTGARAMTRHHMELFAKGVER